MSIMDDDGALLTERSPWSRHPQPGATDDERQGRYDLYEDVIVQLRFNGDLTKAQQHAQCQRIWDAARVFILALRLPQAHGLPPYPEGVVVGPCVCGGWPGGKCLRCEVVPACGERPSS